MYDHNQLNNTFIWYKFIEYAKNIHVWKMSVNFEFTTVTTMNSVYELVFMHDISDTRAALHDVIVIELEWREFFCKRSMAAEQTP